MADVDTNEQDTCPDGPTCPLCMARDAARQGGAIATLLERIAVLEARVARLERER